MQDGMYDLSKLDVPRAQRAQQGLPTREQRFKLGAGRELRRERSGQSCGAFDSCPDWERLRLVPAAGQLRRRCH